MTWTKIQVKMTPRLDLTPDFELIHLYLASRVSVLYTTRRRVNKKANRNAPNFATTQKLCRGETICSHFTRYKSMGFFWQIVGKSSSKGSIKFQASYSQTILPEEKTKIHVLFFIFLEFQFRTNRQKVSKIL